MLARAILLFIVFGVGILFGIILTAVLSANTREEEIEEAYKLGFRDCMNGRAPKVDVRR